MNIIDYIFDRYTLKQIHWGTCLAGMFIWYMFSLWVVGLGQISSLLAAAFFTVGYVLSAVGRRHSMKSNPNEQESNVRRS